IRVDDGYEEGMEIPIFYDPMIGKLIAWGANRQEAIERLCRAIDEFQVKGIKTTLGFGRWAVKQPAFEAGNFDTGFIAKYFKPELLIADDEIEAQIAAAFAADLWEKQKKTRNSLPVNGKLSKWKMQ